MKSIRTRLILNFTVVVVITVIMLELLIIDIIRQSYHKNLEASLFNQVRVSADLYGRYFSDSSLNDNILNNVDAFWNQASAQVQVIDTSGNVLMDSIGIIHSESIRTQDIRDALAGSTGKWVGRVDYDDEKVMAVSYPLRSGGEIVGALRFISSLRDVNRDLKSIVYILSLIGMGVILLFSLLSMLLADSIVSPLKEVTKAAEKMALGDFRTQSRKRYDDEIGRLSDVLNYMAKEIVEREQLKNDFISSVSHELRTPLTSIKGWAITLKDGDPGDRTTLGDGLEIIEKECDRLTYMVEELLDFSRLISGKIEIRKDSIDTTELLRHIYRQMTPRAESEGIKFTMSFQDAMPTITSDENRLKQVFINVLDNAFKFTPSGGEVSLTGTHHDGKLIFIVRDTGCGIPAGELPRVKEKFYKGRNSKSKSGIGLSICDEIIRLMGGSLEIASEVDRGTEVFIILPIIER